LRIAASIIIVAAIIGTFARADIVGLAAAGAWVILSGRLRFRWAIIGLLAVVLTGLAAYEVRPDLIDNSIRLKQNIAQRNVDSRIGLWGVAYDEWASAPIFGVGPGNYEIRFPEFKSPFRQKIETTHNAYLNILAELGLVGLALFALFLVQAWGSLRQRSADPEDDWLRTAIAAGFLVALVGALFMTEQFYPPLWFLAALGVAMNHLRDAEDAAP
jgi:O-antigen ligase